MVRPKKALGILLALSLLLLPSLVQARERSTREALRRSSAFSIWEAVTAVWSSIQSRWDKEGSSLDPFGKPVPPPSGTNTSGTGGSDPQGIPVVPE